MRYFLDRDGARYGPYSLAEVRQYLESGNITPMDRLTPEDGGAPVPAAQLAGPQPSETALPPQPSLPAAEAAADAPRGGFAPAAQSLGAPAYGLQSSARPMAATIPAGVPPPPGLDWWLVLLFSIFTCTLFGYIWAIVQSRWVKKLDPGSRATLYLLLPLLLIPMFLAMAIGGGVIGGIAGRGDEFISVLLMIPTVLLTVGAAIASIAAFISMSNSLSAATAHWGYARIDLGGAFVAMAIVGWLTNLLFLIAPVWIQYQFDRARQMQAWQGARV